MSDNKAANYLHQVAILIADLAGLEAPCDDEGYCSLCGNFVMSKSHPQHPIVELHLEHCPWRRAKELTK